VSLARAALDHDGSGFADAARALGGGWLEALVAEIPSARRAHLEAGLRRWTDAPPHTPIVQVAAWLTAEGPDAGWVLLSWCQATLVRASTTRYSQEWRVVLLFRAWTQAFAMRPESVWLWADLVTMFDGGDRALGSALVWPLSGPSTWPAIKHVLAREAFARRRMLATRLRTEGGVDAPLALAWLRDPTLRPLAVEWLAVGVEAHADALRARLADATEGERVAIVRLLRAIDPKVAFDGKPDDTAEGELLARLRTDPADAITCEVWADLLASRGDPRGEHLSLALAIRNAEPARALALSRAQATLCREHRKALWNRPGGFPFREKYRGRSHVAFRSDWNHKVRGTRVDALVDRLQAFATGVTTVPAPQVVHLGYRRFDVAEARPLEPDPLLAELVGVLGGGAVLRDEHGAFVRRSRPDEPLPDPDAFRASCVSLADVTLDYTFQLAWPQTTLALPYQEGEHYADGAPLTGRLRLHLDGRSIFLALPYPFEDFADPGFVELHAAICATLGRVFTPSQWLVRTPTADGKRMTSRRASFRG